MLGSFSDLLGNPRSALKQLVGKEKVVKINGDILTIGQRVIVYSLRVCVYVPSLSAAFDIFTAN